MVSLHEFPKALVVERGQYAYVALAGRRLDEGLAVDLQVVNGTPKWRDVVFISTEAQRYSAGTRILAVTKQDRALVEDVLLELSASVEGAVRKATFTPEWQPPAPFPSYAPPTFDLTWLPVPALQRFVQQVSAAYQTPYDFAAMGVLGALSGAIGNRRRLHVVGEIYAGATLWIVVIGAPGSGKSDPLEKAMQPLRTVQDKHIAAYQAAREQYEEDLAAWEAAKRDDRGEKPQAPSPSRVLVADHTIEGLALDLAQNPLGMVLYRDELATWLAGFDKYRAQGAGSDRANWLEIWSNKTIDVSRKTGVRVIYVTRPFVSVIGSIQPDRLADLLGDMDDGFSDRLLSVYPLASVSPLPVRSIQPNVQAAYEAIVTALMEMDTTEDGKPRLVDLSARALARYRERAGVLDEALRDPDLPPKLAGAYAKLRIYASRLTLVLHQGAAAARIADPYQVDVPYVDAAWDLAGYFQGHAQRVHAAKAADPEAVRAIQVLELVAKKRWASFNRRQVYMYLPTRFARPDAAEPALKLLVDLGYVREREMPEHKGRGRPPSQAYDVNDKWDGEVPRMQVAVPKDPPPEAEPIPDMPGDDEYGEGGDEPF